MEGLGILGTGGGGKVGKAQVTTVTGFVAVFGV